jgi:LPXTG-site transpeptidase (sortase) family protein
LFVAGDFTIAGGTFVHFIARWDGSHWYALGPGLQWRAFALAVSGTNVYAGGQFLQAGVTPSNRIARWDGTSWYALGAGTNGIVKTLAKEGSDLYVGGGFTNAGGVADTQYIARWDGSHWHAVGGGLNNDVETIASGSLYVGGSFTDAGGVVAADRIARLGNPPPPLPATGFAPGIHSAIPSPIVSYTNYAELTLEIPKLGVHSQIVGVPQTENEWNVDWLGDRIGWLQGTAFPTWAGNTALTAHVYGANGLPGTFVDLGRLRWGDEIVIHAWGQRHVYEVRYNYLVRPRNTHPLRHEAYDWVTLITCSWFDERLGSYAYRRVVRAVLMDVTE